MRGSTVAVGVGMLVIGLVAGVAIGINDGSKQRSGILAELYVAKGELSALKREAADVLDGVGDNASAWRYHATSDEMTGDASRRATLRSARSFVLPSPYEGEQYGSLTVRSHPRHGTDVMVSIERGQLLCSATSCDVTLRIDDGQPRTVRMAPPSSHDSTMMFARDGAALAKQIASADVVFIEVPVYRSGPIVMRFDTEGLDMTQVSAP